MFSTLARTTSFFSANPARFAAAAFLLITLLFPQSGETNKDARLATMVALTTEHTFSINSQFEPHLWTIDWAISPVNGQHYANKPPGPAIIGTPVYFLVDHLLISPPASPTIRAWQRFQERDLYSHIISIILQAIPYTLVILLLGRWLAQRGLSPAAVQFGTWGMLFGTTASLFMNSYFGHGLAALFILAGTLAWYQKAYVWCGLLFGWAALSDYGAALAILPLLAGIVFLERRRSFSALTRLAVGGAAPLFIWTIYHWTIFGSPFQIATRFSNPMFIEPTSQYAYWGIFSNLPNMEIMFKLLFGAERGLLYTQPWILLVAGAALYLLLRRRLRDRQLISLLIFSLCSLLLLLLFNSSFNGWHGGHTAGPRYLSSLLPVFGVVAALLYQRFSPFFRYLLWGTLGLSLALFVTAYSTTILAYNEPLWPFFWQRLQAASIRPLYHVILASAILLISALLTAQNYVRKPSHESHRRPAGL